MGCNQCEVLSINGVACHETGCTNSHIDPVTEEPYPKECKECGTRFAPEDIEQDFCDYSCAASHWGWPIEEDEEETNA